MSTAQFSLPDGWTYSDLRQFLESELQEDFGGRESWSMWLRDFTDADVIYSGTDGALYSRTYMLKDGDVIWGQPSEVMAKTTYQPIADAASFSLTETATDDGEYILRTGKVFEAGNFPDKAFAVTGDELKDAVASFAPVGNDIEHRPSILDGRLGELRSVTLADDGASLVGTVAIPKWLHESIGDAPLKTSLAWDRTTKQIVGNALVIKPRIADAALYAAFSGARHSAADQRRIQEIHDHALALGADAPRHAGNAPATKQGATPKKGTAEMAAEPKAQTRFEKLIGWLGGEGAEDAAFSPPATPPQAAPVATFSAGDDPTVKALQAQIAKLEADKVAMLATAFADEFIVTKQTAIPAERDGMLATFSQAYADDEAHPAVVFFGKNVDGTDRTGSRIAALRAMYEARPRHLLTQELLRDNPALNADELRVVFAAGTAPTDETTPTPEGKAPTAERMAYLKRHIPGAAD